MIQVRRIGKRVVQWHIGRYTVTMVTRRKPEEIKRNMHSYEVRISEHRTHGYGAGYGMTRAEAFAEARHDLHHGPTPQSATARNG